MINRRQFTASGLAAAALAPAVYVWIPKVAIAQHSGDAREAIIRSRTVINDKLSCLEEGSSTQVAQSHSTYSSSTRSAQSVMIADHYSDFESSGTVFAASSTTGCASFGGWQPSSNREHCNHYFHRRTKRPLVYITTVPYLMHSYIIEKAARQLDQRSLIDAFYPITPLRQLGSLYSLQAVTPIILYCPTAIVSFTLQPSSGLNGVGEIIVRKQSDRTIAYREHYEYDFS